MLAQLIDEMGEGSMLPLPTMGLMMVDWLDPHKVVYVAIRLVDCGS